MMTLAKRRGPKSLVLATIATTVLALAGCGSDDSPSAGLEGRTLKVALIAYAPWCDLEGGKGTGLEPDMLNLIAESRGFEVEYSLMDFAATLAGVQSGRYDMSMCSLYWTEERAAKGTFTDSIVYPPTQLVQPKESNITTIAELEGKRIGAVTGWSWNPALEAIPDAKVHTYASNDAVLTDLAAGRIDATPTDALISYLALEARPEWDLKITDLEPPTEEQLAEHPEYDLLRAKQAAWYFGPDQEELAQEFSDALRELRDNGTLAELIEEYEGDPAWLVPPGDWLAEQRRGVDRPDDWEPAGSQ